MVSLSAPMLLGSQGYSAAQMVRVSKLPNCHNKDLRTTCMKMCTPMDAHRHSEQCVQLRKV